MRVADFLLIRPFRCFSPLLISHGTSPKYADTWCPFAEALPATHRRRKALAYSGRNLRSRTQEPDVLVRFRHSLNWRVRQSAC